MIRTRNSIIFIVTITCLFLTACNQISLENLFGNLSGKPQAPQVLRLTADADPPDLDSTTTLDGNSFNVLNNVMEGLTRLDGNNHPQPAMALGYPDISKDQKIYTFRIRNAVWSDGQPVKAQDFEYAWKRVLNPATQSKSAIKLYPILNAEEYHTGRARAEDVGVKALDDRTLQVTLKHPIPYFLNLTASATYLPQRKDIVEKFGENYAKSPDKMVYNGPFVLSDWKHEQSYRYKKNGNYWDKSRVSLDQVDVKIVKDYTTAVGLYLSNQLDVAPLNSRIYEAFKNNKDRVTIMRGAVMFMMFNTQNKFFSNPKIRKAFQLSIDRQQLVHEVLNNGSLPAGGMVPPTITAYNGRPFRNQTKDYLAFDPVKARQLLREGLKEVHLNQVPERLILNVNDDERKRIALFLKKQFEENLGVRVLINPLQLRQKIGMEKNGQFQFTLLRYIGDYNDPMAFLEIATSKSKVNFGRWHNRTFDLFILKSKSNRIYKERNQDLIKAEEIIISDAGAVPLYYEAQSYLQKPYVKKLYRHPIDAEYSLKWVSIEGKQSQSK
ncbi:peptide ABC transporter substrate-binding protein [Lihuaxuella thermophila]|uniref:Oligopeptide transport system substrate-binding protein n=1 Tax=Lihuaxuella thermophila TaxID=1173111 RepID=A0A1H8CAH7_9BACL|nr:peptide ABC transporter substrate-binding protein [Lihuaxuella thermophila]SEM91879.1 oligopeptide transport system substrate-binding protein [Lihuaxuella thermophila]